MDSMTFERASSKPFDETCVALRQAVEAAKWSMMGGYDFGEVLASKGFAQPGRIKTYEICNARYANEMLGADPRIAVCMPCSIAVIEQNGGVTLSAMRAAQAIHQFGEALGAKASLAEQVDAEVQSIIEAAVS